MEHRRQPRRTVTLERVAYVFAIRKAARLGGLFLTKDDRQAIVTLKLPDGGDLDEYLAATSILIRESPPIAGIVVATTPTVTKRNGIDADAIFDAIKSSKSVLVIWPAGHPVLREVALASDRVVDVEPVRPHHLVAAAKAVNGEMVDRQDAVRMLEHPPSAVFAALRKGRQAADVLERLDAAARDEAAKFSGPRLEDMVGYGDARTWGLSVAQDIDEWREGRLAWADVDRGVLLSGPPGTGKTIFAGALARTCRAGLVATSVSSWQAAGYLNDTLRAMRDAFTEAVRQKPCILFIDEFDGISDRARLTGDQHEAYWTQCINLLLELIDGHERLNGVVIVAATNHPEKIDAALRRSGRLDRHVEIQLPDPEARRSLAATYFGAHLSDVERERIASATVGCTGADFERLGREARRLARRAGRIVSIDDVLAHLPEPRRIDGAKRRTVAVHEAGHAVVGTHLGVGVLKTVVVPWEARAQQPAGFAHFLIDEDQLFNREMLLDQIAMILGGRAAEEELLGTAYDGAGASEGADLHLANDLATIMVSQLGMEANLSFLHLTSTKDRDRLRKTDRIVAERVERLLDREMARSRAIVARYRAAVEKVAERLEREALIQGEDVVRILGKETSRVETEGEETSGEEAS